VEPDLLCDSWSVDLAGVADLLLVVLASHETAADLAVEASWRILLTQAEAAS